MWGKEAEAEAEAEAASFEGGVRMSAGEGVGPTRKSAMARWFRFWRVRGMRLWMVSSTVACTKAYVSPRTNRPWWFVPS